MTDNVARLDGLVPDRLRPKTRKIVLEDYALNLDIGFHDFEIGNPQRLLISVEVWVDEPGSPPPTNRRAWDYDFLRTEIAALVSAAASTCRRRWCGRSTISSPPGAASRLCASRHASRISIRIAQASASSWRATSDDQTVIARSVATRQSSCRRRLLDCFAQLILSACRAGEGLAMTSGINARCDSERSGPGSP